MVLVLKENLLHLLELSKDKVPRHCKTTERRTMQTLSQGATSIFVYSVVIT